MKYNKPVILPSEYAALESSKLLLERNNHREYQHFLIIIAELCIIWTLLTIAMVVLT